METGIVLNDEAKQIEARKQCRFCLINPKRKAQINQAGGFQSMSTSEFQQMTPLEVAKMFLAAKGEEFDDGLKLLFDEVMKGVGDED